MHDYAFDEAGRLYQDIGFNVRPPGHNGKPGGSKMYKALALALGCFMPCALSAQGPRDGISYHVTDSDARTRVEKTYDRAAESGEANPDKAGGRPFQLGKNNLIKLGVLTAATVAEVETTRHRIEHCHGHEINPLMKPFAESRPGMYGIQGGLNLLALYAGDRLAGSKSQFWRTFGKALVPTKTAWHTFAAAKNYAGCR